MRLSLVEPLRELWLDFNPFERHARVMKFILSTHNIAATQAIEDHILEALGLNVVNILIFNVVYIFCGWCGVGVVASWGGSVGGKTGKG
jgi:hypothetical protein